MTPFQVAVLEELAQIIANQEQLSARLAAIEERLPSRKPDENNDRLLDALVESIGHRVFATEMIFRHATLVDLQLLDVLRAQGLDSPQKLGIRLGLLFRHAYVSAAGLIVTRAKDDVLGVQWAIERK